MVLDREAIWVALFSLLQGKLGGGGDPVFTTIGRTHVRPPTLAPEFQPALFVVDVREGRPQRQPGAGSKVELTGFLIVYFRAPEPLIEAIGQETQCGGTTLNALLAAIDEALLPDDLARGKLTLGGLVDHCWIEGSVDKDPGIYSAQGAAILPIKMTDAAV